jgi:hypothetical protein
MAVTDTFEAFSGQGPLAARAHELIGQLNTKPEKLAAVVHLLEVMVDEEEEPITEEDRRRFQEGQAFFANSGKGIPMEDVLADFGLKLEDFPQRT